MEYIFTKYLHFVGILSLFSALTVEHVLLKQQMTPGEIKRLAIVDLIYGASAGIVLFAGLGLWFLVGKPSGFYSSNPIFHLKIFLFLLAAAISVYPTVFFIKSRRSPASFTAVPRAVIMSVRIGLLILMMIPLVAVIMAQGERLA